MIEKSEIDIQKKHIPWTKDYMVEQDLLIGRALVSLYTNPIVRDTLVFRGGNSSKQALPKTSR